MGTVDEEWVQVTHEYTHMGSKTVGDIGGHTHRKKCRESVGFWSLL